MFFFFFPLGKRGRFLLLSSHSSSKRPSRLRRLQEDAELKLLFWLAAVTLPSPFEAAIGGLRKGNVRGGAAEKTR